MLLYETVLRQQGGGLSCSSFYRPLRAISAVAWIGFGSLQIWGMAGDVLFSLFPTFFPRRTEFPKKTTSLDPK